MPLDTNYSDDDFIGDLGGIDSKHDMHVDPDGWAQAVLDYTTPHLDACINLEERMETLNIFLDAFHPILGNNEEAEARQNLLLKTLLGAAWRKEQSTQ